MEGKEVSSGWGWAVMGKEQRLKEKRRHVQMDDGTYPAWHGISKPGAA